MIFLQQHCEGYREIKLYFTHFLDEKEKLLKTSGMASGRAGSRFWQYIWISDWLVLISAIFFLLQTDIFEWYPVKALDRKFFLKKIVIKLSELQFSL